MDMNMSMPMSMPTASAAPLPPSEQGMAMNMAMMVPWLHFGGGDNFLFKTLRPSSSGAITGACIILLLIAIFERWIASIRCALEARWARSTEAVLAARSSEAGVQCTNCDTGSSSKSRVGISEVQSFREIPGQDDFAVPSRARRITPPFIWTHDLARGAFFAFQALLAYLLMLAVMTFQAAYIIAIIAGLGIGEVVFGRFGSAGSHVLH